MPSLTKGDAAMNDVSKFMRYTIPGLIFATQLVIALSISDFPTVMKIVELTGSKGNIGIILGAFLASGALGYIFAQIYFAIYWLWPDSYFGIDHRQVFIDFEDKIEIVDPKGNLVRPTRLTKRGAQNILLQYWFSQMKQSPDIEGLEPFVGRAYDTVHSLGTSFISTLIALISWIVIHYGALAPKISYLTDVSICLIWMIFLVLLAFNYFRTLKTLEGTVNSAVLHSLDARHQEDQPRIRFFKSLKD